uniref:Peptidase S1 domain-containing protein n=1 Tax=Anopheles culicifacies TaxID=139723 RepID=A0A2C9GUK3_9DIPT
MASRVWWIISFNILCSGITSGYNIVTGPELTCTTASGEEGICVYQYQCSDGVINTSGENIIDIRQNVDDCNDTLLKCCLEPSDLSTPTTQANDSNAAINTTFIPGPEVGEVTTEDESVPAVSTTPSNRPAVKVPLYDREGCGHRNPNGVIFTIENNQFSETEYGEFPWAVAIFVRTKDHSLQYLCGGALIERAAVLTTATCLYSYRADVSSLVVRVGEWDMSTVHEPITHIDSEAEKIYLHPQYSRTSKINDIAIVILHETLDLNHTIGVVCLPPPTRDPCGAELIGVGWGDVPNFVEPRKLPQTILKKAHLRHLLHDLCQQTLRKLMHRPYLLHHSFICAETQTPEMLPCRGDTGSPYMQEIEHGNDRYYLVGLSSWGFNCNIQRAPTVLTNVAYHREWIDEVIKGEDLSIWSYTYEPSLYNEEE